MSDIGFESQVFENAPLRDRVLKPSASPDEKIFSVSEINRDVKQILEGTFSSLWIEGEVSNFKHHTSGHMYFSLKDDRSQIGVVFFSRQNQRLKFRLEDGLKILIRGRISVYEPRGQYQIYAEEVVPRGVGELELLLEQLKRQLEREGLFDPAHKKPIPKFPKTVGIVTSPTGAAIRDILQVMGRRFAGIHVLLVPVRVQGEGSSREIAQAIRDLNEDGRSDVMIVGRGGGSLEDLWAFNEEAVARAVYASRIPVISAVGHEVDWTICDLVADLRAPTPSAAAELVVQSRAEVEQFLEDRIARMRRHLENRILEARQAWQDLISRYAFRHPRVLIQNAVQRRDELLRQLQNYARAQVEQCRQNLDGELGKLEALSPVSILRRGYSLTFTQDETLIKKKSQLKIGDRIRTRISDGVIQSEIRSIQGL